MYIQTCNNTFVHNPFYNDDDDCSYSTNNDIIELLIPNKKQLRTYINRFFGSATATYKTKVGVYNVYTIELRQPILLHSDECHTTNYPPLSECLLWTLTVPAEEYVNSKRRSPLLKFLVCGPSLTSTNFFKIVDSEFDKTEQDGKVTLCRKQKSGKLTPKMVM